MSVHVCRQQFVVALKFFFCSKLSSPLSSAFSSLGRRKFLEMHEVAGSKNYSFFMIVKWNNLRGEILNASGNHLTILINASHLINVGNNEIFANFMPKENLLDKRIRTVMQASTQNRDESSASKGELQFGDVLSDSN